jgi:hypothetical protein
MFADQRKRGVVIEIHGGDEVALVVTARTVRFTLAELASMRALVACGAGFRRRSEGYGQAGVRAEQMNPALRPRQVLVARHTGNRPMRAHECVMERCMRFGIHKGWAETARHVAGITSAL